MTASKSKSKRVSSDDEIVDKLPVIQKTSKSKSGKTSATKPDTIKAAKQKSDYGPLQPMRNQLFKDLTLLVEQKIASSKSSTQYVSQKDFDALVKCIYNTYNTNGRSFQKKYKGLFCAEESQPVESESTVPRVATPKPKKKQENKNI